MDAQTRLLWWLTSFGLVAGALAAWASRASGVL